MIALGYLRRSKESEKKDKRTGQVLEKSHVVSLETQAAAIRAYCATHGWTLIMLPPDDGVSGGQRNRLTRIEQAIQQSQAGAVVVYHLDRFARDLAALLDTLRAWRRRGVQLHVVGRGEYRGDTAATYLQTWAEGGIAEHYRLLVAEKTRDALAHLRSLGKRYWGAGICGQPPYGFRWTPAGGIEPEPREQATLATLHALAQENGHSLRALSRHLAAEGHLARSGRPFAPAMVRKLLRK